MNSLLDAKTIARAEALGLKARAMVEGLRVGDHKSPYRGFSVEFSQHREYLPGDDLRRIDWKGYARSDRYMIKEFEQDTNFVGHVVLDASHSMLYGEGQANKLFCAKLLAAALSYLIVRQRDSVALNIFDDGWRTRLPAGSQPGHLVNILNALEATAPQAMTAIGPLLHELAKEIRRRGLVFLISDCLEDVDMLLSGLRHLRFGGHEVVVFHVLHNDELQLPFRGNIRFEGLEGEDDLKTRPHLLRPAYLRALQSYLKHLQAGCVARHCDHVLMDTSRPLAKTLSEYLARRLRARF